MQGEKKKKRSFPNHKSLTRVSSGNCFNCQYINLNHVWCLCLSSQVLQYIWPSPFNNSHSRYGALISEPSCAVDYGVVILEESAPNRIEMVHGKINVIFQKNLSLISSFPQRGQADPNHNNKIPPTGQQPPDFHLNRRLSAPCLQLTTPALTK